MKIYFRVLILLFLILPFIKGVNTFSKSVDLKVKTDYESIDTNKEFYINLSSNTIENLYSLSFDFKFNPNLLEVLDIEMGEFFKNEPVEFKLSNKQLTDDSGFFNFYTTFTGNHNGKSSESESELVRIKAKLKHDCKIPFSVINDKENLFIGTPNMRVVLVDKYLNILNTSNTINYIKSSNFTQDKDINNFIQDVYTKTLSREADENGFSYWYNKLISQEYSVRNFLINLLNEKEFIDKNLSDSEFISSMYSIIGGREADELGFYYWKNKLESLKQNLDIRESKSKLILMICNEAELNQRANNLNLKF